MRSPARVLGHSMHPVLIAFPLGLLTTAVIFDILYLVVGRTGFALAAAYVIAAGVLGGLVAAVPGIIDWWSIPRGTRARRIGALHGLGNGVVLVLFAASWSLRAAADAWEPSAAALVLSFVGVAIAGVTGWMGGELVERLGVGVHGDAGLDAPSSLAR